MAGIGSTYRPYRGGIVDNDVTGSDICDLKDEKRVAHLFGAVGIENDFHQAKIIKLLTAQSAAAASSSPTVSSPSFSYLEEEVVEEEEELRAHRPCLRLSSQT